MSIVLVRHGQTAYNRDGLGLGRSDEPLTEHGRAQADATAAALDTSNFAVVYSSPLQRARYAAEQMAARASVGLEIRDELIEMDVGETEGMTFPVMRERYPDFFAGWRGDASHEARMPGGESVADVANRLRPLVPILLERGAQEGVCVVSHNFVQRALLCLLLGLDISAFRAFGIDLASITTVGIRRGKAHIERLNDVCHLRLLEPSGKQT